MKTKKCPRCKTFKTADTDNFYIMANRLSSYCKPCQSEFCKERYLSNLEENRANSRERHQRWRIENPERALASRLRSKYGIDVEEYETLIQECSICGSKDQLVVDHNHKTGEVRGILCRKHNIGIGMFDDDPNVLRRAISYLLGELVTRTAESLRHKMGV